ncbi:hypothetical protein PR001_g1719 [Phytophthora rubi]|uniref:Uncharacterized protein n=1 Tax=Phytophthora rubi TaxID=129364 RepID=A0A6A3PC25_9STRA|nr:hypothetical protein PR002_g1902 [Phytophthora rubi]KAE9051155.1 hypothetical protein PR001_g1719 [Phytophthora rubi]
MSPLFRPSRPLHTAATSVSSVTSSAHCCHLRFVRHVLSTRIFPPSRPLPFVRHTAVLGRSMIGREAKVA